MGNLGGSPYTGQQHGPDGLSRCPQQADDPDPDTFHDPKPTEDWIDRFYNMMHIVNPPQFPGKQFDVVSMFVLSQADEVVSRPTISYEDIPVPLRRRNMKPASI